VHVTHGADYASLYASLQSGFKQECRNVVFEVFLVEVSVALLHSYAHTYSRQYSNVNAHLYMHAHSCSHAVLTSHIITHPHHIPFRFV
jgi:hypothetical protein